MSVIVRYKKLTNGNLRPYLDIHHKATRKSEFISLEINPKPQTPFDKKTHKEQLIQIERIRVKKTEELLSNQYDLEKVRDLSVDFLTFYQDYVTENVNPKNPTAKACLKKLKLFHNKKHLFCHELTEEFVAKFEKYLYSKLNGVTPANYFRFLKKIVTEAQKAKHLNNNLLKDLKIKGGISQKKEVLNPQELTLLARTDCSDPMVKRAFLLSCCTGLRFCDVKQLKWGDIKNGRIQLLQQKTRVRVDILLNEDAKKLLGKPKEKHLLVFALPYYSWCLRKLDSWVINAGLDKHITWHCARHSFGTNLFTNGVDLYTASKLLGHTNTKSTEIYTRYNDEMGKAAISKLPSIL